ncbi:MAG: hypothetical protein ACO1SV_04825 [Fimbriimonas sp.]
MKAIPLRSGDLTMLFDPVVGMLRYVSLGDVELIRGVYAAVRDEHWGTQPHAVEDVHLDEREDGFTLTWRDRCGAMDWQGKITGTGREVTYEAHGTATAAFETQRTGVCLLHPAKEARGAPCAVTRTDGQTLQGRFPNLISPHQPFFEIAGIRHEIQGISVRVRFEGETFEMEDQRNWMDASFKTYCRPLDLPRPYSLAEGETVSHRVTITVEGSPLELEKPPRTEWRVPMVEVGTVVEGDEEVGDLPPKGLLRFFALKLDGAAPDAATRLRRAATLAGEHGADLEVHVRGGTVEDWTLLDGMAQVVRYFVPDAKRREAFRAAGFAGRIWTGTDGNFTELNRERPDPAGFNGVGFAIDAQAHASDDRSIMETPEGLAVVVETARGVFKGHPVRVGPTRFARPGDKRGTSAFAAAWAVAAIAAASQAGAQGLALFSLRDWGSPALRSLLEGLAGQSAEMWIWDGAEPRESAGFDLGRVRVRAQLSEPYGVTFERI